MRAGEYLGQERFTIAQRPARAAYLIAEGSEAGFRRAVQETAIRWGGGTEPIFPVGTAGRLDPLWSQILKLANVDGIVNVDADRGFAGQIAKEHGHEYAIPLDQIDISGYTRFTCHPSFVWPAHSLSEPALWVGADESLDLWAITAGGALTATLLEEEIKSGQPVNVVRDPWQVAMAQLGNRTLMDRTRRQFEEHSGQWVIPFPTVIWLCGQERQLEECLHFWNRRALRSLHWHQNTPMAILPEHELSNWTKFGVDALLVNRPDLFAPDAVLCSLEVSDDRLIEIAEAWGLVKEPGQPRSEYTTPPPPNRPKPFTYMTGLDPTGVVLFERKYGLVQQVAVQVFRDKSLLDFDGPVEVSQVGGCLIDVTAPVLVPYPKRPEIAELIMPHVTWRGQAIQIATNAMNNSYNFELCFPSMDEVIKTLLGRSTVGWKLSDKGRVGQSVLAMPGGGRVGEPGVYEVAKALVTPRSKYIVKLLKKTRDEDPDFDIVTFVHNAGLGREHTSLSAKIIALKSEVTATHALDALEDMVAWGWAQRGLSLSCSQCGQHSFVPLEDVRSNAPCPGCKAEQRYKIEGNSLEVRYRLNSLIDWAVNQGVLPHLLVREHLLQDDEDGELLVGVDLDFGDGEPREADLFGVVQARLVIAEVKSSAADFTEGQIAKDLDIADRFQADRYVMACMNPIGADAVMIAEDKAKDKGIELVVLGPEDLLLASSI